MISSTAANEVRVVDNIVVRQRGSFGFSGGTLKHSVGYNPQNALRKAF